MVIHRPLDRALNPPKPTFFSVNPIPMESIGRPPKIAVAGVSGPGILSLLTPGGQGMGFFSSIIKGIASVAGVVGRAVGILPAVVAPVARAAVRTPIGRTALVAGGLAATAGAAALGSSLVSPGTATGLMVGGGNGRFATQTTIQTFDLTTGDVVRTETAPGRPFLMNRDVAVARRVIKLSSKLERRIPKRVQKQSRASMLKDAIIDNAFDKALCPSTQHT